MVQSTARAVFCQSYFCNWFVIDFSSCIRTIAPVTKGLHIQIVTRSNCISIMVSIADYCEISYNMSAQ